MKKALILLTAVIGSIVLYVDLSGGKFRERIDRERATILRTQTTAQPPVATAKDISALPLPVRQYLRYALSGQQGPISFVRIKQSGSFRLGEKDSWTPVTADQVLTLSQPAFIWHARLQPHPYVWTESRDLLYEGTSRTEHRLFSAIPFPMQYITGKAADASALVRYLTEAPWLPTALLPSKHLSWFPIDATTARAVLTFNGCQVSADFFFNKAGEIVRVATADRSLFRSGAPQKHPWSANYRRYEQHKGIKVPMEMESEWNFEGRSFSYAKLHVESITFEGK